MEFVTPEPVYGDPCEQYTNISDRVGGDILDFGTIPIPSLAEERLGYCCPQLYSPTVKNIKLCSGVIISKGSVDVKACPSGGYYVHKLRPTTSNQMYATSHQNCTESYCGEFAQCGLLGACECKPGYEMPKRLLPTGDTYGCTDQCLAPKVVGRCRRCSPRWYHNAVTNKCERFIYGRCGGNRNNYQSEKECTDTCLI
ncbi:kunitz-type protease inhibitor 1-like [Alosa sapidissima]|uniref:kunitz-type protease inhibitor 1-like n=1 Tax=Alosa sapidissima TaxID=34773 RepID=UPI001C09D495|nr:kunitz-type protease inhibitor 1-like [Alosa sapidissima]